MRHAKSDWQTGLDDHARPLNKRGRRDAPRMAHALAERDWIPDLVVSSNSQRTVETWERMSARFDRPPALKFTPTLYLAGLGALQEVLLATPDSVETALALGHNPGWERAASVLAGRDIRMTTANAVLLELRGKSWAEAVSQPAKRLHAVLRPKEL